MPTKLPLIFYREFGLRKVSEILSPKTLNITDLPRESILHYVTDDPDSPDIDISYSPLNAANAARIDTDYVEVLSSEVGSPRKIAFQLTPEIRAFHRTNRKFKRVVNAAENNQNEKILTVINYSYLYKNYTYVDNAWREYNQWLNIQKTLLKNANALCEKSTFNHFIDIPVPVDIPSRSILMGAVKTFSTSMLKIFDTDGERFTLELWKWFDPNEKHTSIFNEIEEKNYKKINLIFRSSTGKSSIINMAYLFSWIDGNANLTPIKSLTTKRWEEVRKGFLVMFMIMNSVLDPQTESEDIVEGTSETEGVTSLSADDRAMKDELEEEEGTDAPGSASIVKKDPFVSVNVDAAKTIADDDNIDFTNDEKDVSTFDDLDKLLGDLEKINKIRLKQRGIKIQGNSPEETNHEKEIVDAIAVETEIFSRPDNTDMLKKRIDEHVEYGLLSAADMRKIRKDIDDYQKMPDPYGTGEPITKAKDIDPELLKIDDVKSTLKVSKLVRDPSMAKSSLISFEEDYTTKVAKKEILGVVDSLQRGGIIVRDYQIREETNILGSYEVHSVELKPIDGAASTIHFRIPKVNKDGTYTANGNKYKMRAQKVDCPIRKIAPTEVALSSYYGKTFIFLDKRKANSELEYLLKNLTAASFEEDSKVKKLAPSDLFDSDIVAPFLYSFLSGNYRQIIMDGYVLDFDHAARANYIKSGDLAKYEKAGSVVCGIANGKDPIIIDMDDVFWQVTPVEKIRLGSIYDLSGIDRVSAPVEHAIVKVYSKEIPVGVYLSYYIGFSKLLKFLKAKYRVVPPRKQKDLKENEYAIAFKDGTYIFDRNEKKNTLIIGGFTAVEKALKKLEVADLDSKDAYLNLLNNKGITSMHFKEMDNAQDYFIDPITLEILKEMKEPQTVNGLLIRACELLLTYHHPKTQDLEYMRIRGNERMAGYAYGAITTAIRSYRNRNISGRSKIDMSPYEVWSTIAKDESIKIVEDINPIQNLKEKEIVTYTGGGGRGKESMTMGMRAYHKSDIGVISEANIDSGDAGINSYMSPNPEFTSVRGMTKKRDAADRHTSTLAHGTSSILSTSSLLAPMMYKDD